jgi:hypothetical protein
MYIFTANNEDVNALFFLFDSLRTVLQAARLRHAFRVFLWDSFMRFIKGLAKQLDEFSNVCAN